jgi:glycerophosphoryl diester phosphodiesterase
MFGRYSAPIVAALVFGGCASAGAPIEASCPRSPFEREVPLVIAHAGGNSVSPSNTMYALHNAVDMGADVLDLDVRMTSDGVVVARHDRDLSTTTNGAGAVDETTWAAVAALDAGVNWLDTPHDESITVARIDEALASFPDMLFSLEIKQTTPAVGDQLCAAIERTQSADRVFISSNDDDAIYAFNDVCPDVLMTTTYRDLADRGAAEAAGERWCAPSPIGQPPIAAGFDAERVERYHEHGSAIFMWTINEPEDLRAAARAGVDAVYTDRPDIARKIFDEFAEVSGFDKGTE